MVCRPRWNSPQGKPKQSFSKSKPCLFSSPGSTQWTKQESMNMEFATMTSPKARRTRTERCRRASPPTMQCHASIKLTWYQLLSSPDTWRNIYISVWFLLNGPVRSASLSLQTFGVKQLPALWRVATWCCACMTLHTNRNFATSRTGICCSRLMRATANFGWQTFNAVWWKPFAWSWFEKSLVLWSMPITP